MQRTCERSCVAIRPTTAGSETEFKGVAMENESMVNASQRMLPWHNGTYLPYYLHSTGVAAGYILSYLLVLLLCVGGNGLVCLVVLRNRNMRTVTNIFIFNLAVSDLLVGVFCIPTTLIDSLITVFTNYIDKTVSSTLIFVIGWPFSQFTCTMSNLIQGMSVSASVFTLVAIAVDRFMGIVYPFRHRIRPVTALLAILIIWMLAFAIIFPSAATLTVMHLQDTYMVQDNQTYPLFVCYEDWPQPELRRVYTTVIFAHVYLAPLGLISVMYGCIAAKLVTKLRQVGVAEGRRARSRRKAKVVKMLILVAVLFMVSWLPLWTLMLLADYRDLDQQQIDFLSSYLFPVAHWLAFSNSGINPVIYGFYNENFRRGFQAAVACSGCPVPGVAGLLSWTSCSCCNSTILPPNKVSSRNLTERADPHRDQRLTGLPQGTPQGIQGILLEGINRIAAPNHVSGAWEE